MFALRKTVTVIAVVLVGLIAGLMIGTGMDQYTHRQLAMTPWVVEHQVMDALFRRVLPTWWNITALLLVVSAFVSQGSPRRLFAIAAVLMIAALIVTVSVEVPMNRTIASWDISAPPANWAAIRDRWLWFHLIRTCCGTIAFLCAEAGLIQSNKWPGE
jgi:uncharacterized membrane protein